MFEKSTFRVLLILEMKKKHHHQNSSNFDVSLLDLLSLHPQFLADLSPHITNSSSEILLSAFRYVCYDLRVTTSVVSHFFLGEFRFCLLALISLQSPGNLAFEAPEFQVHPLSVAVCD